MEPNRDQQPGTRKLEQQDVQPVDNIPTRPDYPVPWAIELRVAGTPAVIQVGVKAELLIGRSDPHRENAPDINLEPHGAYEMGVSRRHAVIFPRNNRLYIRDLGSANGSYLNGRMLLHETDYRLRHGDTLTIGRLQLQVMFAVMPKGGNSQDKTEPVNFNIPRMSDGEDILIVDNDQNVTYVLRSILEQAGFKVTVAQTYAGAVTELHQHRFTAVLLELLLPDRSGLELVGYIRQKMAEQTLPLLVISDISAGYQMGQAIEAGVDVFMSKPVSIDELLRGINKVKLQVK
jgi:CheY-like chemotaxis protein